MALRYWPNCGDAYTLLGVSAGPQIEIALPLFTLAVMAGAEALGPEGFERNVLYHFPFVGAGSSSAASAPSPAA